MDFEKMMVWLVLVRESGGESESSAIKEKLSESTANDEENE